MEPTAYVFWSRSYALVTLLGVAISAFFLFVLQGAGPAQLLVSIPVVLAYLLQRRARVSLRLRGDVLEVRRGLAPKSIIALTPADSAHSDTPYRGAVAAAPSRASLTMGDDAVLERSTSTTRALGMFVKISRAFVRALGSTNFQRLDVPEHREPMARLALRDAGGQPHTILIPAVGTRNESQLAALAEALGPAGHLDA